MAEKLFINYFLISNLSVLCALLCFYFAQLRENRQKTRSARYSSKSLSSHNESSLTIYTYLIQNTFCRIKICWTLIWVSWKDWHWGRFGTIPVTPLLYWHFATYRDALGLGFKPSEAQSTQDFPIGSTSGLR